MNIEKNLMYKQSEGTTKKANTEKGNPNKKFIPIDEISDPTIDVEAEMANYIDNKNEEVIDELPSEEQILKEQIIDELNKKEEIGFTRNNEGAAHIGPEFNDIPKDIIEENGKEELIPEKIKKLAEKPAFLSITKELRDKILSYFNYRKVDRNTGAEHDNRKTISDSERERASRKEAREVLHNL